MKRKLPWILVAAVLLSAVVIMLWPTKPKVRQPAELSFLHFTNVAGSNVAVFAVHFQKHYGGSSWQQTELDHWESGRWNPWNPTTTGRAGLPFQGGGPMGAVTASGKRIDLIAGFFLPNTNDSWRLRTHVEEVPPMSFVERLTFFGRKIRPANNYTADPRQTFDYWITNVVGPAGSRP
jgi:hypothetical protein